MPRATPPPPGTMHYAAAAAHLGIHKVTLSRLVREQRVRVVRPSGRAGKGSRVLFRLVDLEAYLRKASNF